jgi:AraC family L-rhamnose operon transcriptional activator RhaR
MDAHGVLHLHLSEDDIRRCERHVDDLCEVCDIPDGPPEGARRAQRLGLLLLVLGDVLEGAHIRGFARARLSGLHPAVARGMQLLESDIARSWSLAELAEEVGLERSYLIRQFKRGAGMPPMTYLARRRGERAASLLAHTREPVAAIAQQVGWPDPVHFSRRFKAAFGITATEYRNRFSEPPAT